MASFVGGISRFALALELASAGCRSGSSADTAAVNARLAEYSQMVLDMNHHGIAQLYAADGELASTGAAPIRGPEAIENFLRGFSAYHVLAYTVSADTTTIHGDKAYQSGSYQQRVRIPRGDTVQVRGRFRIEWARGRDGRWLIHRMGAISR
jgi:uncharacterized protein (TIGR02246 family)